MGRLSLVTVVLGAALLFGTLLHAQQQAPSPPPPPPPAYGAPITLDQARAAIAAGETESKKNGWNHVFAVVDGGVGRRDDRRRRADCRQLSFRHRPRVHGVRPDAAHRPRPPLARRRLQSERRRRCKRPRINAPGGAGNTTHCHVAHLNRLLVEVSQLPCPSERLLLVCDVITVDLGGIVRAS